MFCPEIPNYVAIILSHQSITDLHNAWQFECCLSSWPRGCFVVRVTRRGRVGKKRRAQTNTGTPKTIRIFIINRCREYPHHILHIFIRYFCTFTSFNTADFSSLLPFRKPYVFLIDDVNCSII